MTDRLMQSLGQVAREQAGRRSSPLDGDDRCAALCAGELSAGEEEALRAQAGESESTRRAVEAYEPLGPDFRAGIVHRLRRHIETQTTPMKRSGAHQAESGEAEPREAESGEAEPGEAEPAGRPAAVWWRWPATAAIAAAAAAIAVVLAWPRAEPSPVPAYHLALAGGASSSRAEEPVASPRFVAGSPFKLLLRPETAVRPVSVRAFLGHGSALEPWGPSPEVSDLGSVLFEGTLGDEVRLDSGHHVLSIVIGRHGKLPDAESLRDIAADDLEPRQARDWVLVRLAVTVVEDD